MKMRTAVNLVAGFVALGLIVARAAGQSAATNPSVAATEAASTAPTTSPSILPGNTLIIRWDVLLNEKGESDLQGLDSTPVKTASKLYSAAIYDAEALRATISGAVAAEGIDATGFNDINSVGPGSDDNVAFADSRPLKAGLSVNGVYSGNFSTEISGGQVQFKMDYADFSTNLDEYPGEITISSKGSLQFEGKLRVGQAIGFVAPLRSTGGMKAYHLMAWEVFSVPTADAEYVYNIGSSRWWVINGPRGAVEAAQRATTWASGITGPPRFSPDAEHTLSDGKVVRVMALSRMDKWPFCWWDSTGRPTNAPVDPSVSGWWMDSTLRVCYQVTGDKSEWKLQSPNGQMDVNGPLDGSFLVNRPSFYVRGTWQLIGVAVGPWKKIGQIDKGGGSIKVGEGSYEIIDPDNSDSDGFFMQLERHDMPAQDDWVTLSAVTIDGREIDGQSSSFIVGVRGTRPTVFFPKLAAGSVKYYNVWLRKREWVTFRHLPNSPAEPMDKINPQGEGKADAPDTDPPR